MRRRLIRKNIPIAQSFVALYNRECTGTGNNDICGCK